jgi:2-amino-4-hydroxy-6-hydroxymethyldihydropteridine diphosphokinase
MEMGEILAHNVYISLGSNLGNREQYLKDAKEAIRVDIGGIVAESSIYDNEAVGFDGNSFLNQVIHVETLLSPENLLKNIQAIEIQLGRTQKTVFTHGVPVYQNRIIDIDIILYDDLQIDTETLTIPHPRMYEREFVMRLLWEVRNER